jgi:hypothetical protein
MEAAAALRGSDEEAFAAGHNYTHGFYRLAEYCVTLTLRQAIEKRQIDCVRATDMIGGIFRDSGRAGFAHVRWSAGTAAHSVAAFLTTQNDQPRTLLLDGMVPSDKPEVWPEAYFRGHAWPAALGDNPPPYAVELYVRGLDNYVWAEGYIIRDAEAGTLLKAAVPYLRHREQKTCQKVFEAPGSAPAGAAAAP